MEMWCEGLKAGADVVHFGAQRCVSLYASIFMLCHVGVATFFVKACTVCMLMQLALGSLVLSSLVFWLAVDWEIMWTGFQATVDLSDWCLLGCRYGLCEPPSLI